MIKKIKLSKKQIDEIIGEDINTYLKNGGVEQYNGLNQVRTSGEFDSGKYGDPIDTDKFASVHTPQTYYGQTMMPYGRWSRFTENKK